MLQLNNLKSPKGSHRNIKRIGRGEGSGQGKQAGKGHKGQKARTGGGIRTGFEGGALPLYMKLPKRGFSNAKFKKEHAVINLSQINKKFKDTDVTKEKLIEAGLLKGILKRRPVKVLGTAALESKINFVGIEKFSKSAKDSIEKAGGSIGKSEEK
jgi:large subunit ribosomal protein L15